MSYALHQIPRHVTLPFRVSSHLHEGPQSRCKMYVIVLSGATINFPLARETQIYAIYLIDRFTEAQIVTKLRMMLRTNLHLPSPASPLCNCAFSLVSDSSIFPFLQCCSCSSTIHTSCPNREQIKELPLTKSKSYLSDV